MVTKCITGIYENQGRKYIKYSVSFMAAVVIKTGFGQQPVK
jgi:hypothetical protein